MTEIIEISPGIREYPKKSTRATLLRAANRMKSCDKIIIIGITQKVVEKQLVIESHCYDNCDDYLQKLGLLQNAIQNVKN